MTWSPASLLMVLGLSALAPTASSAGSTPAIVIQGVAVLDVAGGRMLADRSVVIEGDTIRAVAGPGESISPPNGATVVDGRHQFLIPGLIDAHVHLVHVLDFAHVTGDEILPLFLAAGVTSVRDIGDEIVAETLVARLAEASPDRSPRVFLCSPLIDGDPPFHRDIGFALTDPARVPAFVDEMAAWRVTTLKIYVKTPRQVGRVVIEAGHRRGMKIAGHLGAYSAQDAVADGIDVLEHIWSVFNYIIPPEEARRPDHRATLDLDNPKARGLIAAIRERGTFVDPTLSVFRNMILLNDQPAYSGHPDNATVPKRLLDHWDAYRARSGLKPATLSARRGEFERYQKLTGVLHRAGVRLLAGTDTPEPFVPPGLSLHQELEMLVESGLRPAEALRCATLNNAKALGQAHRLGSVEPGKLADLVLLRANPLDAIANTRAIARVIRGGLMRTPEELRKSVPRE